MVGQPHYCIIVRLYHTVVESLPSDVTIALHRIFVPSLDTAHEDIMLPFLLHYDRILYGVLFFVLYNNRSHPQCMLPHTTHRCDDLMFNRAPQR